MQLMTCRMCYVHTKPRDCNGTASEVQKHWYSVLQTIKNLVTKIKYFLNIGIIAAEKRFRDRRYICNTQKYPWSYAVVKSMLWQCFEVDLMMYHVHAKNVFYVHNQHNYSSSPFSFLIHVNIPLHISVGIYLEPTISCVLWH